MPRNQSVVQKTLLGTTAQQPSPQARRNIYAHDSSHLAAHHWYTTVAGYSSEFVLGTLKAHGVTPGKRVLDPFSGCGTTALTVGTAGYSFGGTEANPFHHLVASTKLDPPPQEQLETGMNIIDRELRQVAKDESRFRFEEVPIVSIKEHLSSIHSAQGSEALPELKGWLSPGVLARILNIRNTLDAALDPGVRAFFYVALGSIILPVSNMQLAGPKIAYRRKKGKRVLCVDGPATSLFLQKAQQMVGDSVEVRHASRLRPVIKLGDARRLADLLEGPFDIAITSPPYLNEVDYLENTRMEMFCLKLVSSNAQFKELKTRMIRANSKYLFNTNRDYPHNLPKLPAFDEIAQLCAQIHKIWATREWGWDHPRLVAEYFVDMATHLRGVHKLLLPGGKYVIVVGDSAIDGILVPTDNLLATLGTDVGFTHAEVRPFRWRGSSRHTTRLRESIITLTA